MSDSEFDFDDLFDEDSGEAKGGMKALRAAYKKLQKERDAASERASKAEARVVETTVKDVLTSRGVDQAKVARLTKYMKVDEVDLGDQDAVGTWLEENAEDFGLKLTETTGPDNSQIEAELAKQTATADKGTVPGVAEGIAARMRATKSNDELKQIWKESGFQIVSQ